MKVCSVCNEIVSAGQGCARSDCPNQAEALADAAPKLQPGYTGKADRFVQAGLDGAGGAARDTTRRTAFIALLALGALLVTGLSFFNWSKSASNPTDDLVAMGLDLRGFAPSTEAEPAHPFYQASRGPSGGFSFEGIFGGWDNNQLRRGYQVYKEVCSACHSLQIMAFQDLEALGMSQTEMRAEAAEWSVLGVDPSTGEAIVRSAEPSDYFPLVYPNPIQAAASNNGVAPPDLSMIVKVRNGGSDYIYSLLTGYGAPDPSSAVQANFETPNGLYFNKYSSKGNIAMPPPLFVDGQINYTDGTSATVPQMAADITAFLTWSAETLPAKRN